MAITFTNINVTDPLVESSTLALVVGGSLLTSFQLLPSFSISLGIAAKVYRQEGDLRYEYNPFRNLRLRNDLVVDGKTILKAGDIIDFNTDELNFDLTHPVDIEIQESYDGSINMILNDDKNPPMLINSRFTPLEDDRYKIIDRAGNNDTNIYNQGQLSLQTKLYKTSNTIPKLNFEGLESGGANKAGNYTFFVRYSDADGNETDIILESGVVSCYIGNLNDPFSAKGGVADEKTDKIIKFSIENIDLAYDYMNIYFVRSTSDYDKQLIQKAYKISNKIPIERKNLNNGKLNISISGFEEVEEISIDEINVEYNIVNKAKTQCQCQNMLILSNVEKENIPYKELTDLSLRIYPTINNDVNIGNLDHNYVDLNNIGKEYYDAVNVYNYTGYWNKEMYRLGIVYIMRDNSLSPVFNTRGGDNIRNIPLNNFASDINNLYTYIPVYNNDGSRKYIDEGPEFSISNGKQKENTKGVIRIMDLTGPITNDGVKPLGIQFNIEGSVLNEMSKLAKGFFFVRQKRIPTTLCQGLTIGVDDYSGLPMLYAKQLTSATPSYFTESFVTPQGPKSTSLAHYYDGRLISTNNKIRKGGAILSPDSSINNEFYSQLFTGSEFVLTKAHHQIANNKYLINSDPNRRHYYIPAYYNPNIINALHDKIKLTQVNDSSPKKSSGTASFSSRAGIAEEAWRLSFIGQEEKSKTASNVVRGSYCSFIGAENYNSTCDLVDIHIPGYNEEVIKEYILLRANSAAPFFAISNRYDFSEFPKDSTVSKIVEYRGDCYVSNFTVRIQRNFQDPETPINDIIVDTDTWNNNYKGISAGGSIVQDNLKKINRSDVNAVQIGHWATFKVCSNINTAFRCTDDSKITEQALTGTSRTFYPLGAMSTAGNFKIPESTIANTGYSVTVNGKQYTSLPDIPYIKNTFFNRVMFSDVHVNDAFRNGYRVFSGANYKDYPMTYGAIVKTIEWYGNIIVIFEQGVGLLVVNERAMAADAQAGDIFLRGTGVLPSIIRPISTNYGSIWKDSIVVTANFVYGVDTKAKKIWRTNGETFEIISDFKVQKFLNDNIILGEREKTPFMGVRNISSHYNVFKQDVMFTFYDLTRDNREVYWNLCYNEQLQTWITRYSWMPLVSANINNIFFTYSRDAAKKIAMLGYSDYDNPDSEGITLDHTTLSSITDYPIIKPKINELSTIYNLEYDMPADILNNEYDPTIFSNSLFTINNTAGVWTLRYNGGASFGKTYYFIKLRCLMKDKTTGVRVDEFVDYIAVRPAKSAYSDTVQYELDYTPRFWKHGQAGNFDWAVDPIPSTWYGVLHPFEFEYVTVLDPNYHKTYDNMSITSNNTAPDSFEFTIDGAVFELDRTISKTISNIDNSLVTTITPSNVKLYQKCKDVASYGRLRGNSAFKEDIWYVEIKPIYINELKKEARIRDKYLKTRVRYKTDKRALITSAKTNLTISYA